MEVHADRRRGHIALVRGTETVVTFVDLGPVLQVWQYGSGVELNFDAARQLGSALIEWVDRKAAHAREAS